MVVIRKRIIKGWDEEEVHTKWRKVFCYTQRAGVCKSVKRRTNRRERREGKIEIRNGS